jgi:hypothetical protein
MLGGLVGSIVGGWLAGPIGACLGKMAGSATQGLLKEYLFPSFHDKVAEAIGKGAEELVSGKVKAGLSWLAGLSSEQKTQTSQGLQKAFRLAMCEALYDTGGEQCFRAAWKSDRQVPQDAAFPLLHSRGLWNQHKQLAEQLCGLLRQMERELKADPQTSTLLPLKQVTSTFDETLLPYIQAQTPAALAIDFFEKEIGPYLQGSDYLLRELAALGFDFKQHLRRHLLGRTLVRFSDVLQQHPDLSWQLFTKQILSQVQSELQRVVAATSGLPDRLQELQDGQQHLIQSIDELRLSISTGQAEPQWSGAIVSLMAAVGNLEQQQDQLVDIVFARLAPQYENLLGQLRELRGEVRLLRGEIGFVGADVKAALDLLQDIAGYLHGVNLGGFAVRDDCLIARAHPLHAMLRESQTYFFERLGLFAGRSSELARIHGFLATHPRGYVFVTGSSGFGKTALLANLIKPHQDNYLWYFFEGTQNRRDFLRQVCEQMLAYYQTGYSDL